MYERPLPGSQLLHRLQDMGYRVATAPAPEALVDTCRRDKPILLIAEIPQRADRVCAALLLLHEAEDTSHIPVIAVVPSDSADAEQAARRTGAKLVVQDSVILAHLPQFLEQALQVD